ncbi:MAG TPA: type II toxin-antitoxin system RelE/ParE family toxin [Caulobacteraceae bacterium]|nr:type II toxin-antitoxin system RelE/ParE family toxin [Caulobacteraceae bacterium]
MNLVWSAQARTDLDEIWLYVAQDRIDAADRLIDRLVDAVRPLADFPRMGMSRSELAPDLRAITNGAYVIFYRALSGGVRVERVLHGRRDITAEAF